MVFGTANLGDEEIRDAVDGCESARTAVLDAVAPQVRLMVRARLGGSAADDLVDELAQQAIVGLMNGLARLELRSRAGLRRYLSSIVSRRVADHFRRARNEFSLDSRVTTESGSVDRAGTFSAKGASPRSAVERGEDVDRLLDALETLDERGRRALTLAFFDQLTTGEIAEQLGVSRPAASMVVLRATRALRRAMTGQSRLVDHPVQRGRSDHTRSNEIS